MKEPGAFAPGSIAPQKGPLALSKHVTFDVRVVALPSEVVGLGIAAQVLGAAPQAVTFDVGLVALSAEILALLLGHALPPFTPRSDAIPTYRTRHRP